MYSFADQFKTSGGRPAGFDYMRLLLAIGVIGLHSIIVCYGQIVEIGFWQSPLRPFVRMILPMFFVLSGFLVAGSLLRTKTIGMFLGLRAIRIFPALTVEVLLSALILGPLFTSLALSNYFTHPQFFAYFWNVVGHVHFMLPGVFDNNPYPNVVNGQLWTVPFELYCYVALGVISLANVKRAPWVVAMGAITILILYIVLKIFRDGGVPGYIVGPVPGALLIIFFLIGVLVYLIKEYIPYSHYIGIFSLLISSISLSILPYGEFISIIPVSYFTVYIGLMNPSRTFFVEGADYSYGLFLYGYPIQQALVAMNDIFQNWAINFIFTMVFGLLFAAMSWHAVEKPALGFRTFLQRWEDEWLRRTTGAG